MPTDPPPLRLLVEAGPRKAFAVALDHPGLARSGRDEAAAITALGAALPRMLAVARVAEPGSPGCAVLESAARFVEGADSTAVAGDDRPDAAPPWTVVERVPGDAGTAFGVPSVIALADRMPVTADEAARLTRYVAAAWTAFDAAAARAPAELRKGPRGGGRNTAKVVEHVLDSDQAYAAVLGLRHRPVDRAGLDEMRAAVLELLAQASDGSPVGGRRWPARYAARRIAWHALDHAWEIEDRTDPGVTAPQPMPFGP